ncbi:response regulator [candidate division KSB1 bacterium]|nr:response regulator [candidate division KSB1 bacterium]
MNERVDKGTVLLIDDEQVVHQYIAKALVAASYKMLSAYSGAQGIRMIDEHKPDAILLDYMMPEMNGYEVYEQIVQHEDRSSIPTVILTAVDEKEEIKDELLKKGLSAYLEKPFGHRELINIIENIVVTNRIQLKNKQLHKAIKDTNDFLENLIHSSPDAIITLDMKGGITSFSSGAEKMFGFPAKDIVGSTFVNYLVAEPEFVDLWGELIIKNQIINYETEFLAAGERQIPVNFSLSMLKNKQNENIGVLAIGKDLSEIKKLERELIEKEKLALLMETTVAINHEINNPLTPVLGNIQLILDRQTELPDWVKTKLHVIEKNAWRIQQIVQKLNKITQPVRKKYCGETQMLDIERS